MITRRGALLSAAACLAAGAARAELGDPIAQAIAANPVLATVAARDAAAARALAQEAARMLAAPPSGQRSLDAPTAEEAVLLRENRLLEAVYRHDPAAALDLLTRVLQAGGQRR